MQILGQIALFPYDFQPEGWMFCKGDLISIADNVELFTLLGTAFGGDGEQTFALPDYEIAGRCPYCISIRGTYQERQQYEGIVGETLLWVTPKQPENVVECTGQSIPSATNRLLQHHLGTRFGNKGENSIVLPDLRGYSPSGSRSLMVIQGENPDYFRRQYYLGEILLLPYDASYEGLRICNGELLQIEQHNTLFNLVTTRFGGDGKKTFALPDLRASAPPKFNYYLNVNPKSVFPARG